MIRFDVLGTPAAKGSPHARVHNGHVVVHEPRKVKNWEGLVRERAFNAVGLHAMAPPFCDVALRVAIVFRLVRPAGHWGKGKRSGQLLASAPRHPHKKPDIDKLVRATLDPLIGIVFDDDSRIVCVSAIKEYASPGREGATIGIALRDDAAGLAIDVPHETEAA